MKWLKFLLPLSLIPNVTIHIHIPRRWRPHREVHLPPEPTAFDPRRRITPLEGRLLGSSNAVDKRKPLK